MEGNYLTFLLQRKQKFNKEYEIVLNVLMNVISVQKQTWKTKNEMTDNDAAEAEELRNTSLETFGETRNRLS